MTADVVVVGTGPAGMAATATAHAEGASVVAIEATETIGGNAVRSNGYLAFVGSDEQSAHNVHDTVETFIDDAHRAWMASSSRYGLIWDGAVVQRFAAESRHTYRMLTQRGVRFTRLMSRPGHTVDRLLAVEDPAMFAHAFAADFASPRVHTIFGARAGRLHHDGGRVAGVRAHRNDGTTVTVHARHGVVLATGGYQANPTLRVRYQPESTANSPYLGLDTCRGDGHTIGAAVGADLVNMTFLPPMVIVASTVAENAIAINTAGTRFHDETAPFGERVTRLRAQPGRSAWYLLDSVAAHTHARLIDEMPYPPVRAETVADLATSLGIPGDVLAGTVARWNAFLANTSDTDPDFGRRALPRRRHGLTTPPFTAVAMVEGVNFSCGGFRTTTHMQVIDNLGTPIAGLYSAGDTTSGLNAAADLTGLHIAGALTMGRVAGHAAAHAIHDTNNHGSPLDHLAIPHAS